jgi:hypothetical protein
MLRNKRRLYVSVDADHCELLERIAQRYGLTAAAYMATLAADAIRAELVRSSVLDRRIGSAK